MPLRIASALILSLLLLDAAASAAPPVSPARMRFDSGTRHFNLAEFNEALVDFNEAYRLRPDPAILYNIAQSYRRLDDYDHAVASYQQYLHDQPAAPNRADVEQTITELQALKEAKRAAQQAEEDKARAAAVVHTDATISAPPPARPTPVTKKPWFWVAVVGGVAVVATGVALGVVFGVAHAPHAQLGTLELH